MDICNKFLLITANGFDDISQYYSYDSYSQLTRVDSQLNNPYTATYTYDIRGNLTSKNVYDYTRGSLDCLTPTSTTTFTYANTGWKDQLVAVNGTELTYDANGNVLTYGSKEYSWTNGRDLAQITDGDNTYSYTYDENGIRTSKTVNGATTYYNTKDGVILSQTDSTDTWYFQYDSNGVPMGFIRNGVQYFYMTNQMGDVIGINDCTGDSLVIYLYDEWGKVTEICPTLSGTQAEFQYALGEANPLRYRGYYYDNETGYYYLQSRYYDPSICRFINSDVAEISGITKDTEAGTNLFAYCNNNPVNNSDPTGKASIKFIGFGIQISVAIGRIIGGIEYIFYKQGNRWNTALFAFLGGSSNFNNVTKTYNKIFRGIKSIKSGFSLKKLLKAPNLSVSAFVIVGNKNASISNYTGWFSNYGITYKHASLSVAISRNKKVSIASIGIGLTTQKYGLNFSQTMYFRYDKNKKTFNILSTLKNNIYNKVAWIKFAGALVL